MDPNTYESRSDDKGVVEETDKQMIEQKKKDADDEKAQRYASRCRRRAERKKIICDCGGKPITCDCREGDEDDEGDEDGDEGTRTRRKRRSRRGKKILSQNPFIIFYLEMYFKMPDKHVTEVARQAGKEWCALPEAERMKYVRLAERERKRRRRLGIRGRRRRRRRRRRRTSDV